MIVVTAGMWMARASRGAPLAVAVPVAGEPQAAMLEALQPMRPLADIDAGAPASQTSLRAPEPAVEAQQRDAGTPADAVPGDGPLEPSPIGYRWIASPWRTGPDGRRDYAAMHGKTAFYRLAPESSRLRPPPV
jgi:hypothetical protein